MINKIYCFLFGHKWDVLRIGHGKAKTETSNNFIIISTKMYWHWHCKSCGLYHCNRRFKRYIK